MTQFRNSRGTLLNTPVAWSRVPGASQISDAEFHQIVAKGGFEGLPKLLTWEQYEKVLRVFFPWKAKIKLCLRCEGHCTDRAGHTCLGCQGRGVERQSTVA